MVEASSASWRAPLFKRANRWHASDNFCGSLWNSIYQVDLTPQKIWRFDFGRKNWDSAKMAELWTGGAKFHSLLCATARCTVQQNTKRWQKSFMLKRQKNRLVLSQVSRKPFRIAGEDWSHEDLVPEKMRCNGLFLLTIHSRNRQAPTPTDWEIDGS